MSEPIHIISLGAGVQSSTMALMSAWGELKPMPKCAIFADTQDEPKSVYTWLDWLEKQLPYPVHRVTAGRLSERLLKVRKVANTDRFTVTTFPAFMSGNGDRGMSGRQCTSDFKIAPIAKEITRQMRDSGTRRAISWMGISLDEAHRMKPSRRSSVTNIWPLIDKRMSRHDCELWIRFKHYPMPPKSACDMCPYHSDNEWRRLRNDEPESFDKSVKFEKELQSVYAKRGFRQKPFLHTSRVPLDQVDFSTDEDHGQQVMFGNECEGMCGV